jgi:hypothetical protein
MIQTINRLQKLNNIMKTSAYNPTMMIKSKFSNEIHKLISSCYGIKPGTKEYYECKNEIKKNPLTDNEKVILFDEIMELHYKTSRELILYFYKRKLKNKINNLRMKKNKS